MRFLILLFATCMTLPLSAQLSGVDLHDTDVVFYGIDFTAAKMIGSEGFTNPDDIAENYLGKWNALMFDEQEKYNVPNALLVSEVRYDLDPVTEHNKMVDPSTLVIDKDYTINEDRVAQVVKGLDMSLSKYNEGQGFIMVVESFDKTSKRSYIWCTIFDIASQDVIATQKMDGKASGFGLRNYWANSFGAVLSELRKKIRK